MQKHSPTQSSASHASSSIHGEEAAASKTSRRCCRSHEGCGTRRTDDPCATTRPRSSPRRSKPQGSSPSKAASSQAQHQGSARTRSSRHGLAAGAQGGRTHAPWSPSPTCRCPQFCLPKCSSAPCTQRGKRRGCRSLQAHPKRRAPSTAQIDNLQNSPTRTATSPSSGPSHAVSQVGVQRTASPGTATSAERCTCRQPRTPCSQWEQTPGRTLDALLSRGTCKGAIANSWHIHKFNYNKLNKRKHKKKRKNKSLKSSIKWKKYF